MLVNLKKLEIILVNKEMSFADLMTKTGISASCVGNLKKGGDMRIKTVSKIVKALDINVEDIV